MTKITGVPVGCLTVITYTVFLNVLLGPVRTRTSSSGDHVCHEILYHGLTKLFDFRFKNEIVFQHKLKLYLL